MRSAVSRNATPAVHDPLRNRIAAVSAFCVATDGSQTRLNRGLSQCLFQETRIFS
jgi:hypothetical protein